LSISKEDLLFNNNFSAASTVMNDAHFSNIFKQFLF
jgi:hypothetical protein